MRSANGWLSIKKGRWVYRWITTRAIDQRRVEQSRVVGRIAEIGRSEKAAWAEVERLGFDKLIEAPIKGQVTFKDLADHFIAHELRRDGIIRRKAEETIDRDEHNINRWLVPSWGSRIASDIKPLEVERWYEALATTPCGTRGKKKVCLTWPTIAKIDSAMSQVFKHALRHGLTNANPMPLVRCKSKGDRESVVVTPEQMIKILEYLFKPETLLEWTLALLCSATALRGEEAFGLQWDDVDWERNQINIRRAWSKGKITAGKNEHSMTNVALHPVLGGYLKEWRGQTVHAKGSDWIFPSVKCNGRIPRSSGIAAKDYLRPAAISAGVLAAGDTETRFGWHSLRHSLATFFASNGVDQLVTMKAMRHKKLSTTAEIYTHQLQNGQIAAQGKFLEAINLSTGVKTGEMPDRRQ